MGVPALSSCDEGLLQSGGKLPGLWRGRVAELFFGVSHCPSRLGYHCLVGGPAGQRRGLWVRGHSESDGYKPGHGRRDGQSLVPAERERFCGFVAQRCSRGVGPQSSFHVARGACKAKSAGQALVQAETGVGQSSHLHDAGSSDRPSRTAHEDCTRTEAAGDKSDIAGRADLGPGQQQANGAGPRAHCQQGKTDRRVPEGTPAQGHERHGQLVRQRRIGGWRLACSQRRGRSVPLPARTPGPVPGPSPGPASPVAPPRARVAPAPRYPEPESGVTLSSACPAPKRFLPEPPSQGRRRGPGRPPRSARSRTALDRTRTGRRGHKPSRPVRRSPNRKTG